MSDTFGGDFLNHTQ